MMFLFPQRHNDPLVLCLRHRGTGKEYLKADTEEQIERLVKGLPKNLKLTLSKLLYNVLIV